MLKTMIILVFFLFSCKEQQQYPEIIRDKELEQYYDLVVVELMKLYINNAVVDTEDFIYNSDLVFKEYYYDDTNLIFRFKLVNDNLEDMLIDRAVVEYHSIGFKDGDIDELILIHSDGIILDYQKYKMKLSKCEIVRFIDLEKLPYNMKSIISQIKQLC